MSNLQAINSEQITSDQTFNITPIQPKQDPSSLLLGYYVTSTAAINVEDTPSLPQTKTDTNAPHFTAIAQYLLKSNQPEIVFHIHGYAVSEKDALDRYFQTYQDAAAHLTSGNHVFIGYRWPSENPKQDSPLPGQKPTSFFDKLRFSFQALPTLPLGMLISSCAYGFIALFLALWGSTVKNLPLTALIIVLITAIVGFGLRALGDARGFLSIFPNGFFLLFFALLIGAIATFPPISSHPNLFLAPIIAISILVLGLVLALIVLRLSTYQRDRSRASNYGVNDLVKFFQYLEKAILTESKTQQQPSIQWKRWNEPGASGNEPRIKISLIAHSLGCEVATQTIRILSDVFDEHALSQPTPNIGKVFSLGRLVLVAPDIPVESILTTRSNFLISSLRRCEEAYIFSNEADLALRLASTAANYFSFPFRTRFRGYKLGNITVDRQALQKLTSADYGIVNCPNSDFRQPKDSHKYLEIRASVKERKILIGKDGLLRDDSKAIQSFDIADSFTYFDCTDYEEIDSQKVHKSFLSLSKKKSALNFWWDYIWVSIAYFLKFPREIDVHGGYFHGEFSNRTINELAFLGYKGLLLRYRDPNIKDSSQFDNLKDTQQNELFEKFSNACKEKYIQIVLASKDVPNVPSSTRQPPTPEVTKLA